MRRTAPRAPYWLGVGLYVIVWSLALANLFFAIQGATLGNVLDLLAFGS